MKEKIKQQDKIIKFIEEHGSATVRELFIHCNINSPAKRVSELRRQGLIETRWVSRMNDSGETIRYVRYFLRKEEA